MLKADYEYKITMMQNRIGDLERESEDASNALKVSKSVHAFPSGLYM